jgi:predicted metal-dependent phosphoesterase TrpH
VGATPIISKCPYYADLHIHSTYSDGLLSPFDIISVCKDINLKVISITDHDTISGVEETIELAKGDIEVIPAVELSSNIGDLDIHILGYYIDYKDEDLCAYLKAFKKHRVERIKKIIKKLSGDGINLEFEQIKVMAKNCSLGRPHIAEVLVENGYVRSINEAFEKYLGYDTPYYEPKKYIESKNIIQKIKNWKGVPVIAHPGTINNDQIIYQLIMDGVLGLEVWHPDHTPRWQQEFYDIALKNGLVMNGGSDCHGRRSGSIMIGCTGCSKKEVDKLNECHGRVCSEGVIEQTEV